MSRTTLTANLPVYVAPPSTYPGGIAGAYWSTGGTVTTAGDDVAGNGTQAAPFATPQRAIDWCYQNLDCIGQWAPTITMACKVGAPFGFFYPRIGMSGRLLGQPGTLPPMPAVSGRSPFLIGKYNPFTLLGDTNNRKGALICSGNSGVGTGYPTDGPALALSDGAALKACGLMFDSGQAFQDCVDVMGNSFLDLGSVVFGTAGDPTENIHCGVAFSSTLFLTGDIEIDASSKSFIQVGGQSVVIPNNNTGQTGHITVNVKGVAFQTAMYTVDDSTLYHAGIQETGSIASGLGIQASNGASIENGTGPGPNTCPVNFILGRPNLFQDTSTCR